MKEQTGVYAENHQEALRWAEKRKTVYEDEGFGAELIRCEQSVFGRDPSLPGYFIVEYETDLPAPTIRGACCGLATKVDRFCVCAHILDCPIHGERHVGTHD